MMNILKRLIILLLLVIVGCADEKLSEEEYIEKAKIALDSGNYRESQIHLKNALAIQPNNAEARFLLGDIYVRGGNGGGAEKELNRALELGVVEDAIMEKLADALLMQGKLADVFKQFEIKDGDTKDVSGQKLVALGDAYFQKNELEKAKGMYDRAVSYSKSKMRAQLGLARILALKGEQEEAVALVEETIKENASAPLAWLTRADVHKLKGDDEEVITSFLEAISKCNSAQDFHYYVAMKGLLEQHLYLNNTQKASEALSKLRKSFYKGKLPNIPEINHLRAILAFQEKNYEVAMKHATDIEKVNPNHHGALLILGTINGIQGNYEQSESYLERFLTVSPRHIAARKILGFVQLKRNEADQAVETLKPFEKAKELDAETLALIASASLRAGDAGTSEKYYLKALDEKPDSAGLRGGLAQSYLEMGDFERALQELEQIRSGSKDKTISSVAIVETLIRSKKYSEALSELTKLEKNNPREPLYTSLKGSVYILTKEMEKAEQAFNKAIEIKAGFPPAGRNLALIYIDKQKNDEAESIYKQILNENPNHIETLYDYAQLKMLSDKYTEAESFIKKAAAKDRDKTRAAVHLSRVYIRLQKPSLALAELRNVNVSSKNQAVLAELGNAQMMLGEYNNALDSYKKLASSKANSHTAHYLVYTAYMAAGSSAEAENSLNKSLSLNKEYLPAVVAKAGMLMMKMELSESRKWIQQVEKISPTSSSVILLNAELAMRESKPQKAIEIYRSVFDKSPTPVITQKLAQAYWASGKQSEALNVLKEALNNQQESSHLYFVLGTAYGAMGQEDDAIKSYEKAIELNRQNVFALNNLAWLLKDTNKQQALTYAQLALDLAPKNKNVQDTMEQIRKR